MTNKPVKIYAIHYNRPEFIRWQYQCFTNHMRDLWELTVVNNARDPEMRKQINLTSEALACPVIETHAFSDAPVHLVGKHHADSLNYVWKNYMAKDKGHNVMFMDGDCFMVAPMSINAHMDGVSLCGAKQQREFIYHYLTPVVIIANIDELPDAETLDWEGIGVNGTRLDTGGGLYNYFLAYPEVKEKVKGMHCTWHIKPENGNMDCIPDQLKSLYVPDFNVEFFGNEFLHYCRSSNWDGQSPQHHVAKSNFVSAFLNGTFHVPEFTLADGTVMKNPQAIPAKQHNFQIPIDTYFGWGKHSE